MSEVETTKSKAGRKPLPPVEVPETLQSAAEVAAAAKAVRDARAARKVKKGYSPAAFKTALRKAIAVAQRNGGESASVRVPKRLGELLQAEVLPELVTAGYGAALSDDGLKLVVSFPDA
jgi:hypothetical protein